eukprot:COSAG01_NODE_14024_length_1506_cov_1.194030_1_plen_333_part_10
MRWAGHDGWTYRRGKGVVSFLYTSPDGLEFTNEPDALAYAKRAKRPKRGAGSGAGGGATSTMRPRRAASVKRFDPAEEASKPQWNSENSGGGNNSGVLAGRANSGEGASGNSTVTDADTRSQGPGSNKLPVRSPTRRSARAAVAARFDPAAEAEKPQWPRDLQRQQKQLAATATASSSASDDDHDGRGDESRRMEGGQLQSGRRAMTRRQKLQEPGVGAVQERSLLVNTRKRKKQQGEPAATEEEKHEREQEQEKKQQDNEDEQEGEKEGAQRAEEKQKDKPEDAKEEGRQRLEPRGRRRQRLRQRDQNRAAQEQEEKQEQEHKEEEEEEEEE